MTQSATRTRIAIAAGVLALAAALPRTAHAAESFYGVTSTNTLVTFHSDSPGALQSSVPLRGLQPGEQVVGLDVRPATGQLYALGSANRIYVVQPLSGALTQVGKDPFTPPLAGTSFGFDFNPTADRIRVLSDGRQNLRLNPENGAVAAQDPNLAYADGDTGAGLNPRVGSAAYTTDGKLFALDSARDVLVRLDAPNDGKLNTVGPLGADVGEPVAFDIASDNRAWVAAPRAGVGVELLLADVAKGTLTPGARYPTVTSTAGSVTSLAAAGTVPDDSRRPDVLVDVDSTGTRTQLRRGLKVPVSCSEACTVSAELLTNKRVVARQVAGLPGAGRSSVKLGPTARSRELAKRSGAIRLTLRVRVVDAAGNRRALSRHIRLL